MSQTKLEQILKWYLLLGGIYLVADALFHILGLRMLDIVGKWDNPAVIYADYMSRLYGLMALLVALVAIIASTDVRKYKKIIYLSSVWLIFYGLNLIYNGLTIDFPAVLKATPSMYAWMPFYNGFIIFEALIGFGLAILTFLWYRSQK